MKLSNASAREVAERIRQNVADVNANRISWEEFSKRNRAAWDAVTRGELPIIGSAASRRMARVEKLINMLCYK